MLNTQSCQMAPSQGLREVAQPSPLSQVSLGRCHALSLTVPQLVEAVKTCRWIMQCSKGFGSTVGSTHGTLTSLACARNMRSSSKDCPRPVFAGEFVVEGGLCPLDVANVHNVDGRGTPLYANICFEDWVVLLWRVELDFVALGFPICNVGPGCLGVTEHHVARINEIVLGRPLDTTKIQLQFFGSGSHCS